MNSPRAWKLHVSLKPAQVILILCVLLGVSVASNISQYCAARGQWSEPMLAAEGKTKSPDRELKRRTGKVTPDERLDQLYEELDKLSRLNEQLLQPIARPHGEASRTSDRSIEAAGAR